MPPTSGRPAVSRPCVFCGATGTLTREHVFGEWLTRIGLDDGTVALRAGPLNRLGRDLGITRPFRQTVRDVCAECNGSWMSGLESVARRVLTPFILGETGTIEPVDSGAVAAWVQKTALIAMLVSSEEDRARGYGLPPSEYSDLFAQRDAVEPLPDTHVWIGRYEGAGRTGSVRVVPQVVHFGESEDDEPGESHGYAMTIVLGELLLHGLRLTTPQLQLPIATERTLPRLWPLSGVVSWPAGTPIDDAGFLNFSGGREFDVGLPRATLRPWRHATDLAASREVGSMVELPMICGEHIAYYPAALVHEAMRGCFHAFMTSCDCERAYLIETASDGAHCKAAGSGSEVGELYGAIPGDEYAVEDENGRFFCKRV
jgi:hypothetical protein